MTRHRHTWVRAREDALGNDVICDEHSTIARGVGNYRQALRLAKLHDDNVSHEGDTS